MNKDEINIGGSSFWILLTLVAISSLVFLLIWSFFENSIRGAVVSIIFLGMILASSILSRLKVFDFNSWGDNTLSFTIGFWLWIGVGSFFGTQSVLSVSSNQLFATISGELPQLVDFVVNTFLVPIAEELFWIVALPFAIISMLNNAGNRVSFFKNGVLQIIITVLIGATTFAFFHVGNVAFVAFIISAMIFRTLMVVLIYGEQKYDIIKGVNLVAGFAVGAHIANNLSNFGINKAILLLQENFLPVGLIVYALMILLFLSGIERLISLIAGKKSVAGQIFEGGKK